ncbi:bifunctional enoyl-CoA hydratase/phosphate acetyltransferase [Thiolapillus sp.]
MKNLQGKGFKELLERARTCPPLTVAVVDAGETHVLQGVFEARDEGLLKPVLIGRPDRIQEAAQALGHTEVQDPIIPVQSDQAAAEAGVELVLQGKANALAKGWIHTDMLLHPVVRKLRTERRVSHVFVAQMASYHKLLCITDAAINIEPDLLIKAAIVQNAIDLTLLLGIKEPKVAALSAVEVVKPGIASTIDAACLSKMAERGQIKDGIVDGPLAFDNAISAEAARIKDIHSPIAGDVDILLAPDLNAANILAKNLEYLAGATLAGIVVGAKVPIILPSRSDPPLARLVAAALAVLSAVDKDG